MDREWTRRDLLALAAGGFAAAGGMAALAGPAAAEEPSPAPPPAPRARTPVLFVGHGPPMSTLDPVRGADWTRVASGFPRPRAVLAISAHWERGPVTIGATRPLPLIYDFSGFPAAMYRLRYAAPGAPALADRVEGLLRPLGEVRRDPRRGHDHGAWCPLRWLYPEADVPVLSLSLPTRDAARLVRLGRALAPLREEGTLIYGSGNVTHNLRALGRGDAPTPAWAADFDAWCADAVGRRDLDRLVGWTTRAPAARTAHPTPDHFDPLLVAFGAGVDSSDPVRFPVTGFEAGSISRRCVQIG